MAMLARRALAFLAENERLLVVAASTMIMSLSHTALRPVLPVFAKVTPRALCPGRRSQDDCWLRCSACMSGQLLSIPSCSSRGLPEYAPMLVL
jgi:hypothetical protein